jgi:hypothetical protein
LVATAGASRAQDLEVFALDTMVDPSILTRRDADGAIVEELGYWAVYLRAGLAHHYQSGTVFSDSTVQFVDATTFYVHRRMQLTLRATELGDLDDSSDGSRGNGGRSSGSRFEARAATYRGDVRYQVSLARQSDTGIRDGTTAGLQVEVGDSEGLAGLRYAYLDPDEATGSASQRSRGVHSLSFSVRTDLSRKSLEEKFGVDLGFSLGAVHSDQGTHFGNFRSEFRVKWITPSDRWRVYAVWAPAYEIRCCSDDSESRRLNSEISMFLHWRIATRVVDRDRKRPMGGSDGTR